MSIPRGCVMVARGLVGEGCRVCVCVFVVLLGEGSVWSVVVRNGVPSLCGFSVWVPVPGWCGGCQGVGFGEAGLACVCSVFLEYGRMG